MVPPGHRRGSISLPARATAPEALLPCPIADHPGVRYTHRPSPKRDFRSTTHLRLWRFPRSAAVPLRLTLNTLTPPPGRDDPDVPALDREHQLGRQRRRLRSHRATPRRIRTPPLHGQLLGIETLRRHQYLRASQYGPHRPPVRAVVGFRELDPARIPHGDGKAKRKGAISRFTSLIELRQGLPARRLGMASRPQRCVSCSDQSIGAPGSQRGFTGIAGKGPLRVCGLFGFCLPAPAAVHRSPHRQQLLPVLPSSLPDDEQHLNRSDSRSMGV